MNRIRSRFASGGLALFLLLSACGWAPRGSGLEREVLRHPEPEASSETGKGVAITPAPAEFAIAPVTRARLASYAAWPTVNEPALGWIGRVDQPNVRIINPGDSIGVHIWSTEENGLLTVPGQRFVDLPGIRVAPDGNVFLPYIGEIHLAGMSVEKARAKVQEAYVPVTPSAQVQIDLAEGRQSTVSLISGVAKPGAYPLIDQDVTVLELIAEGGGMLPNLENPQIRLQRGSRLYGISMEKLLETPSLNTTLRGGDKVYVEEDKRYFLSLGATARQTQVHFPQDRVTALDAMSLTSGLLASRANAKGILILRQYPAGTVRPGGPPNQRTIFTLDLTSADGLFSAGQFQINSGDLVYATESPLGSTSAMIGVIAAVFGIANAASSISSRN